MTPPAHLVLILGCRVLPDGTPSKALRRRVQAALRGAGALPGVRFLAIGGARGRAPAEAIVIERLLLEAGVPASDIVTSPHGRNTIASLRDCWPLLEAARAGEPHPAVYVCTDAYHAPRCRVILALWGLRAQALPAAPHDLSKGKRRALSLRDGAALLKDIPLALLWRAIGQLRGPG